MLTLSKAVEGFLITIEVEGFSPNSLAHYDYGTKKLIHYLDDQKPFAEITSRDIEEFLLSVKHLAPKTRINLHAIYSSLWDWGIKREYVDTNIVRGKVPRPKPVKHKIEPLTEEEVQRLFKAMKYSRPYKRQGEVSATRHKNRNYLRNRAILMLIIDSGLRSSEVRNLRRSQIDIQGKLIRLKHQTKLTRDRVERTVGKGNKEGLIPFGTRTAKALWDCMSHRNFDSEEDSDPFIFLTRLGNPMTSENLLAIVKIAARNAGIEKPVNVHLLRHTFATLYRLNGGTLADTRDMLRHSDIRSTLNYDHSGDVMIRKRHPELSPADRAKL